MLRKRKHHLTKEGLEKIKSEYENLKKLRLAKIKGDAPPDFRLGDLDSEFFSFQEDVGQLDAKIAELEKVLEQHQLIKVPPRKEQNRVHLGARVLVEMDGVLDEFKIVGVVEVDPSENKISNESPLGKALLGKKIGDVVEIKTPILKNQCRVIKIQYGRSN